MSTLQELLKLQDPLQLNEADVPVELQRLFSDGVSANFAKKAIEKLWGGRRLTWHGDRFFDHNELGAAYVKAEEAAEAFINDGYNEEVNMQIDAAHLADLDEDANGEIDFTFDVEFGTAHGGDHQEVYLGYSPSHDKLYIGFDAWVSEDNFNDGWDAAFKEATGTDYDSDNEEHQAVFNEAWTEYKDDGYGFWGLVFEITNHHGEYSAEEALPPMAGGFYKGSYKLFKSHHPDVVDMRLD